MYDFSVLRQLRKRNGLTIAQVGDRAGVSPAVISKLERNQTQAELETLYRLSRVFGIKASELIELAESGSAQRTRRSAYRTNGFTFDRISYGNARCMYGSARAGGHLARPEVHGDDYEICWVVDGRLELSLPSEKHTLSAGDAVQFDAVLEHGYEVLEDCHVIILHITKAKRF